MDLLVSFINFGLSIHVAREVIPNQEVITTPITSVSLKRIKERTIVIGSKHSTFGKLLRLFKSRIWFELASLDRHKNVSMLEKVESIWGFHGMVGKNKFVEEKMERVINIRVRLLFLYAVEGPDRLLHQKERNFLRQSPLLSPH